MNKQTRFRGTYRARLHFGVAQCARHIGRKTLFRASRAYRSGGIGPVEAVDVHKQPPSTTKAIRERFPMARGRAGQVWLAKSLESDVILALQFWPALKDIQFGPAPLDWEYEGLDFETAFLMAWHFKDGRRVLVDVQSRDVIWRHRLMRFAPALREAAKKAGYDDFHFISESVLANRVILENAALVHASARDKSPLQDKLRIEILKAGRLTIKDLKARVPEEPRLFRHIMTAFATQDLAPERIDLPFDDDTVLLPMALPGLAVRKSDLHRRDRVSPHLRSIPSMSPTARFLGLPENVRKSAVWRWTHVEFAERAFERFKGRKGFERRPEKGYARIARLAAAWVKRKDVRERLKRMGYDKFASPSGNTLRNWCMDARKRDEPKIASLVPRSSGTSRLNPAVVEVIKSQVEAFWLTKERPSLSALHARIMTAVSRQTTSSQPVNFPANTTIKEWINMNVPFAEIVRKRQGERAFEQKFRPVLKGRAVNIPLQEVQIDHACLDFMGAHYEVSPDNGKVEYEAFRPYLTIAVDRATGMVVGFHIDRGKPSSSSILASLKHSIRTKQIAALGCTNPWPVEGLPQTLLVDNGTDFHSHGLAEACAALNIRLRFAPAYDARTKGIVEGFIKKVQHQFCVRPARTFHNIGARGDNKPELSARESLNEIRSAFTRWIVDDYHTHPRPADPQKRSPLDLWNALSHLRSTRPYADDVDLSLLASQPFEMRPDRQGIRLGSFELRYNSDELFKRSLDWAKANFKAVHQRFNEADVSCVEVFDPKRNEWFTVPCVTPDVTSGLSLADWQAQTQKKRHVPPDVPFQATKPDLSNVRNSPGAPNAALKKKKKRAAQYPPRPEATPSMPTSRMTEAERKAYDLGE